MEGKKEDKDKREEKIEKEAHKYIFSVRIITHDNHLSAVPLPKHATSHPRHRKSTPLICKRTALLPVFPSFLHSMTAVCRQNKSPVGVMNRAFAEHKSN